jgi:hypothetical protein
VRGEGIDLPTALRGAGDGLGVLPAPDGYLGAATAVCDAALDAWRPHQH